VSDKPPPTPGRATVYLVLVTLFWGISFPLVRTWQDATKECPGGVLLASATLIAMRFILALCLLLAFESKLFRMATLREYIWGGIIGGVFFVGFVLQVYSAAKISPAMSAFLTAMGCAWVPPLGWLMYRLPITRLTWVGIAVGIAGIFILSLGEEGGWELQGGETLTLICSLLFSFQILFLDKAGQSMRPMQLSAGFFLSNAILGLALMFVVAASGVGLSTWWDWTQQVCSTSATIRPLGHAINFPLLIGVVLLVIFPTVLAFHWMNTYQPYVPANRAALLYLLEPVFAGIFSVIVGMNDVTGYLLGGGALILLGNLVVEMSRGPHKSPVPSVIDQG